MNEAEKLVSIGMPTRNHANSIRHALDSLLAQTYKNLELIIVDGASTDETQKICEKYQKQDSRIRYIRKEENGGMVKDLAATLSEARGEYFMWAADDDWWDKRFIEKTLESLESSPNHDVAMSHFSERGTLEYSPAKISGIFEHDFTNKSHYQVYSKMIKAKMNPVFFHGLYRREFLSRLYQRLMPDCIDGFTIFTCEAALATNFYSVKEVLYSKYKNPVPITLRHAFIGKLHARPLAYTNYIFIMIAWLLSSPNIPLARKHLIFIPWVRQLWHHKRKILNELFI